MEKFEIIISRNVSIVRTVKHFWTYGGVEMWLNALFNFGTTWSVTSRPFYPWLG